MIRIVTPRLVPVVELPPGTFATESREHPDVSSAEEPVAWTKYWSDSLEDSGLSGLHAVSPASWFVLAKHLGTSELAIVLAKELSESSIPGFPDSDGEIEDCLEEAIGALSGGYALVDGSEVLLEPNCCGDLGNLSDWREALRRDGAEWEDLWIGHPQLCFRLREDDAEIKETQEYEQPQHPRHFSVSAEKLRTALKEAAIEQEQFESKVRKALSELSPLEGYSGERLHLLARLLVGRI